MIFADLFVLIRIILMDMDFCWRLLTVLCFRAGEAVPYVIFTFLLSFFFEGGPSRAAIDSFLSGELACATRVRKYICGVLMCWNVLLGCSNF